MTKSTAAVWLALAALLWTGPALADIMTEGFFANGGASVKLPPVFPLGAGGGFSALESFGAQAVQSPGAGFVTDFNTGGHVLGTYSGNFSIQPLGGPPHGGHAIASGPAGSFYTLTLTHGPDLSGIDYFGMDIAAIGPASVIKFIAAGSVVASVTGAELLAGSAGTPFAVASPPVFVAFTDQSGQFDQVQFTGNGAFVSDAHVIGNVAVTNRVDSLPVEEPPSGMMLGLALVAAGAVREVIKRRL